MITNNLAVISAICGNFWQESTVNPGIWENLTPNSPGYGLGQWTDIENVVYRRTALFNYLDNNGYSRDSGIGQLNFLIVEDVWVQNGAGYPSQYNTLTDFLTTNNTNISDLTMEFFHHWEGIDDGTGQVRIDFANQCYNILLNDDGVTRWEWYTGNYYNSRTQALRNCLRIKDFFFGISPVPPEPPEPLSDEEIMGIIRNVLRKRKTGGFIVVF